MPGTPSLICQSTNRFQAGMSIFLPFAARVGALRSGRAFLMETVRDIWGEAKAGAVSLERRAILRLATTHGIRLAAQVIDTVYNAAGATAAYGGNLIQRHFQDIHVITQHLQGRMAHYELVGRHWLGLSVDEGRL